MRIAKRWLWPALFLLPMAMTPGVRGDTEVDALLESIKKVGSEGRGNAEARKALRSMREVSVPADLVKIVLAMDGADVRATNWLRLAGDMTIDKALARSEALPVEKLQAIVLDTKHDPRARRTAYEWLVRSDPKAPDRLVPKFLNDPAPELRRDAIAVEIKKAQNLLEKDPEAAKKQYLAAFEPARDSDQVQQIAVVLQKLDHKVDLPAHFGIIEKWQLLAPFDNTEMKGFAIENLWKVERPRNINWVTPLIVSTDKRSEVLVQSDKEVSSYDLQTGTQNWKHEMNNPAPVPSLLFAQGMVLAPGREFTALKPGQGSKPAEEVWTSPRIQSGYTSPVFYQDRIYYVGAGVLNAVDAKDGSVAGQIRIGGKRFWASPVIGNGNAYITSEDGTTTVVELGEKMKIVSTNELEDTIFATPALVNGAFYIRSDRYLYCIGEKK